MRAAKLIALLAPPVLWMVLATFETEMPAATTSALVYGLVMGYMLGVGLSGLVSVTCLLIVVSGCSPQYASAANCRQQPKRAVQNRVVVAARNQAVVANVASVSQQGTTQFGYENLSVQDYQTFGDPLEEDRETPVAPVRASAAQQAANARCTGCHSATKASGGLDMTDLEALSNGQRESVRDRLLSDDPALRMPKAKPGAEFKALGKPAMDALLKWTFEASEQ